MPITCKSFFIICVLSMLALACDRPNASQVHQDVVASLRDNKNAKTRSEWEASENNNEVIFKRWQESHTDPKTVCAGLIDKSGQDLSLFEEEIKSEAYKDLIAPCRDLLIEKIESYWQGEKTKLQESNRQTPAQSTFKFPLNRQTRNVSKGYKTFSGDLAPKEVVITFDDGPHPVYTDLILAALAKVNAKALFFAMGKNVNKRVEIVRRVGRAGHSVGSHSMDHKCLPIKPVCEKSNGVLLTMDEALAEIRGGHQAVEKALGWVDPFFRFPYGETSPELSEFLKNHSVGEFVWSVDTEDWKNVTPAELLAKTMAEVEKQNGGIILMHDIHRKTAEVLPDLLNQLYFKGFSIVLLRSSNPWDRRNSKLTH